MPFNSLTTNQTSNFNIKKIYKTSTNKNFNKIGGNYIFVLRIKIPIIKTNVRRIKRFMVGVLKDNKNELMNWLGVAVDKVLVRYLVMKVRSGDNHKV